MSDNLPEKYQVSEKNYLEPTIDSEGGQELLDAESGWIIGVRGNRPLRFNTEKHMLTIAGTGEGKGSSVAIPNLLMHEGSAFSLEMAGSTYKETVKFRRHVLKQKVYVIDPWGATDEESATINLLDTLDINSIDFFDDVRAFGSTMLKDVEGRKPQDTYFEDTAHKLLCALLIYIKRSSDIEEEDRNISKLIGLCSAWGTSEWEELMQKFALDTSENRSLLNEIGNYHSGNKEENVRSIFSSMTKKFMDFMSPAIMRVTSKSSLSLDELKDGNTTIYVIFKEAKHMVASPSFVRLLVERTIDVYPNYGDGGRRFQSTHDRLLMLLDEFTQLGKLDSIVKHMVTVRQKGITIWPLIHGFGQLAELYGENEADIIWGAAGVVQVFGVGDTRTLELVSKRYGKGIKYIPQVQHGISYGTGKVTTWSNAHTLGNSTALTEGQALGDTETWGISNARGTTNTLTKTSGSTASNAINEYSGFSAGNSANYDPRGASAYNTASRGHGYHSPATGGMYNTGTNSGTGNTRTAGRNESLADSFANSDVSTDTHGGGRQLTYSSGKTDTQSASNTETQGGSESHNETATYSVTYAVHILPKLDIDQAEEVLGSDSNQILFIRAKNKVLRLIDRRAFFFEIPFLRNRAFGPAPINAPGLLPKPAQFSANTYQSLPVVSVNLDFQTDNQKSLQEFVKLDGYEPVRPMVMPFESAWDRQVKSKDQLIEDTEAFHTEARIRQGDLLRAYISTNQKEEEQNKKWAEIFAFHDQLSANDPVLVAQEKKLRLREEALNAYVEKLLEYKGYIVASINDEEDKESRLVRYSNYLKYFHEIRDGWTELSMPDRPDMVHVSNEPEFKIEEIKEILEKRFSKFSSRYLPKPQAPDRSGRLECGEFNYSDVREFLNEVVIGVTNLEGRKSKVNFEQLNSLIDRYNTVKNFWGRYRNEYSIEELLRAKSFVLHMARSQLDKAVSDCNFSLERFDDWLRNDGLILKAYAKSLENYKDGLDRYHLRLQEIEGNLDRGAADLIEFHDLLDRVNASSKTIAHIKHNEMASWDIWTQIEQQTLSIEEKREVVIVPEAKIEAPLKQITFDQHIKPLEP